MKKTRGKERRKKAKQGQNKTLKTLNHKTINKNKVKKKKHLKRREKDFSVISSLFLSFGIYHFVVVSSSECVFAVIGRQRLHVDDPRKPAIS